MPAIAVAADATPRVASTVRADARSGRLVRTTVVVSKPVTPAVVEGKLIAPKAVENPAPAPDVNDLVERTAKANDVDPLLVHSVIKVESNYNPYAVSPKGALGLMQLIPSTARRFGVSNSFDAEENIAAGVRYLKYLQDTFKDDRLALAAYNAGEGAVMKYGTIPPYRETEQYVQKVGKYYGEARKKQPVKQAAAPQDQSKPQSEPLRPLEVATDAEGRIVLRTR